MMNFPFYALRKYVRIFEEGNYKVVETHKNRYILDYVESDFLYYSERRLALLREVSTPYIIYPIKHRITSMSQLISSRYREFIDVYGKVFIWTPKKFKTVTCHRVSNIWRTPKGGYAIKLSKIPTTFILDKPPLKYAQVINVGKAYILYDLCDEMRKDTRKKI